MVPITHEQNIICSKTRLDGTTHEQTIICRQLFVGHMVGSRPMERKKTMRRMVKGLKPWKTRTQLVADTNFSPFARARNICCGHKFCVQDTRNVSDFIQKHFVSATNVSQFAQPKKHHGQRYVRNNMSSFARALMSRTMVLHVRFESLFISLPSSAKQQREMTKFYVFWRT